MKRKHLKVNGGSPKKFQNYPKAYVKLQALFATKVGEVEPNILETIRLSPNTTPIPWTAGLMHSFGVLLWLPQQ